MLRWTKTTVPRKQRTLLAAFPKPMACALTLGQGRQVLWAPHGPTGWSPSRATARVAGNGARQSEDRAAQEWVNKCLVLRTLAAPQPQQ